MKNFLLFFLKYDLSRYFSGSLAVWKECGEAAATACLPRPARRGEAKNSFELYSIYTASQDLARNLLPRASRRLGARLPIYIHFWLKKKIVD